MNKRSHRYIRDLVAHPAFQGLYGNEIGCVRISMMAESKALHSKGRVQMRETTIPRSSHLPCTRTELIKNPRAPGARERKSKVSLHVVDVK